MTFQFIEYLIFLLIVFLLYLIVCRGNKTRQNALIVVRVLGSMRGGIGGVLVCFPSLRS